ncbi:MAG: DNA translocase FtsK 4TM domain-containing protein [Gemmatimonadetes bacterium]|nr:DNA translocase FtsK 4TM domain-containing protein [Gemmatimonadota bacterium]MDA1104234.1 DNA translocase FtsK 4TM domain-containing protein [Gemmatimonadota bacterium]
MLTQEQRREILAVVLLAAALFLLLSLLPVSTFGSSGAGWFPSGNMIGPVGGTIRGLLVAFVGSSAVLVPVLFGIAGVRAGQWLSAERAVRYALLATGLMILVPMWIRVSVGESVAAGWLGNLLGAPLLGLVGGFGALLATGVAFVALCVATLGWNPLRSVGQGVMVGGDMAGRTAKVLADKRRELAESRARALAEREGKRVVDEVSAVEGLEPEWLAPPEEDSREADESDEAAEDASLEAAVDELGFGEEDLAESDPEDDFFDPNAGAPIGHEVPPVDLLSAPEIQDRASMERELDELGEILIEKLRTFNVESTLAGRTTGPVVTQFEVVPAPGVKVNRIANLDADLALAMKAKTIRIVAPIPGRGAVGVEIPNPQPEIVNLREILEQPAFRNAKGEMPLALGKDLHGKAYVSTLEKMPHVLIAGATGAGKSVCLNTIVTSLVYRHTPETLRLLMIDPKMVELSVYSRLPHLRHNVVTDPRDAAGVLKWAVLEMERRYTLLKVNHVRSLQEFNRKVRDGQVLRRTEPKGPEGDENRWIYSDGVMPYIVVVIDELADLMMTVQSEVEKPLTQLAQKARAIGIHLIVATQRPSVNVITGLIKANFPTRIAFRVASKTDSRTILDQNGADALLGNGDMLFLPPGGSDPVRIQGAYLSTEETERLMGWYVELLERRSQEADAIVVTDPSSETDILEEVRGQELTDAAAAVDEIAGDWDDLFRAAAEICIQNGGGSTSLLQRRLSIGYGRAARIVDQLHDAGVLGPSDGAKGREVLVSMGELDSICGVA